MRTQARHWCVESKPSKQDLAVVSGGVIAAGRRAAAGGNAQPIACFLREDEKIVAGACGRTEFGRLFVDFLWVAEDLRNLGLGTEALARLEAAARERGARDALIETMSDRVAALYRRAGYREIAAIEAYVGPFTKHVLLKTL